VRGSTYEDKPQGQKRLGNVYAGGARLARQQNNQVYWVSEDPLTRSVVETAQNGFIHSTLDLDPLGGYVGSSDPYVKNKNPDYSTLIGDRPSHTADADPFDPGSGCTLDGVPIDCNQASGMINNGSASFAPLKTIIPIESGGKYIGFGFFNPNSSNDGSWFIFEYDTANKSQIGREIGEGEAVQIGVKTRAYFIPGPVASSVRNAASRVQTRRGQTRREKRSVGLSARGPDENAFDNRARQCGIARKFSTGQEIIDVLKKLSGSGPIDRINLHDHGAYSGVIGATQNYVGLYIGNPSNYVYQSGLSTFQLNTAGGAATAEELASAIVDGSINLARNAEITFFGCNSDALASHLSFILNADGRGDIFVTGASGNVYEVSPDTAGVDRAWWNTYRYGGIYRNTGRRRSYR
jgi:hypothetical protein